MAAALASRNNDSLVVSGKHLVATVNMDHVVVIETDDAVLVTQRGSGQDVKKLLELLEAQHRPEATDHTEIIRPWSRYRIHGEYVGEDDIERMEDQYGR